MLWHVSLDTIIVSHVLIPKLYQWYLFADGWIIFKLVAIVQAKLNCIFMSDLADFVFSADDLPQSYNRDFSNTRTGLP